MKFIGAMVDKNILTSVQARIFEIAFYWAVLSVLVYIEQCLQTNSWEWRKVPLVMFLTSLVSGVLSGYAKQVRELQAQKQDILDTVQITVPDETTPI